MKITKQMEASDTFHLTNLSYETKYYFGFYLVGKRHKKTFASEFMVLVAYLHIYHSINTCLSFFFNFPTKN